MNSFPRKLLNVKNIFLGKKRFLSQRIFPRKSQSKTYSPGNMCFDIKKKNKEIRRCGIIVTVRQSSNEVYVNRMVFNKDESPLRIVDYGRPRNGKYETV